MFRTPYTVRDSHDANILCYILASVIVLTDDSFLGVLCPDQGKSVFAYYNNPSRIPTAFEQCLPVAGNYSGIFGKIWKSRFFFDPADGDRYHTFAHPIEDTFELSIG